jgi:hypothetical protein
VSDITGGVSPNPNGSPIFPGTLFTGPLLAGNVVHSDGSGTLAALGETNLGTANVGYCVMAQSGVVTQASGATTMVIPAQSQILAIYLMVTTAWSGASANLGIGTTALATAFTAANAVTGSATLGQQILATGTSLANQISNWDNVGSTDVQILVTSANTGAGVGTLTVVYLQGINNAS